MVAVGTTMSAFWILSAQLVDADAQRLRNHRRQVPRTRAGWTSIFNPSFPYRLAHKLLASTLTASFLIAGLSAWQLLRNTPNGGTHKALRVGVIAAAIAIPLQIVVGDLHGLNTLQHQPAKIAAIEGIWHTEKSAPLTLFGWPNEKEGRTDYAIQVPEARQPDPGARHRRRTQGPERIPERASAGGAGVLELSRDGRHGHADAAGFVVGRLGARTAQAQTGTERASRACCCGCWRP